MKKLRYGSEQFLDYYLAEKLCVSTGEFSRATLQSAFSRARSVYVQRRSSVNIRG